MLPAASSIDIKDLKDLKIETGRSLLLKRNHPHFNLQYIAILRYNHIMTTTLNLKPTHKAITAYYAALNRYQQHGVTHETAVRAAFQALLEACTRQLDWTLICEQTLRLPGRNPIRLDGAMLDEHSLPRGTWEAKGVKGNLHAEIDKKFDAGYPQDNILFQTPERAILYQHGTEVMDADITEPETLVTVLQRFFAYERANAAEWHAAVARFKELVPELGAEAANLLQTQHETNAQFRADFAAFHELCKTAINPNLSAAAVQEMLIQHLLTERMFCNVFDYPDFAQRNVIAREIEKVLKGPLDKVWSRGILLEKLTPFYREIEREAATLVDFSQKQHFLNTVYEQFFQGFSVKQADTHGIVYTPQPIVDFMVNSAQHLLQTEFNHSLADEGVHIIDAFVGTGNFIVRLMRDIPKTKLEAKYRNELWCNEVLLLPYYIATLNIEHEFYAATGTYLPFEGISLVDTFELAEDRQLSLLTAENTARVAKQQASPMFVVIGNPPYNAGQINENDNNKNRNYPTLEARVRETYAKDSTATLKNSLYDTYVKALRWASDRIGEQGIVALVTNNSFLTGTSFDGMRKHLAEDFDAIYIVDLGGNARRDKLVADASVFGIRVGVSINFFVKNSSGRRDLPVSMDPGRRDLPVSIPSVSGQGCPTYPNTPDAVSGQGCPSYPERDLPESVRSRGTGPRATGPEGENSARIFYYRTDDAWNKHQKFEFLTQSEHVGNVDWQTLEPDARNTWLTEGLNPEFLTFMPMGSKAAKLEKKEPAGVIFHKFSNGLKTNRDAWAYNFNRDALAENMQRMIGAYNAQVSQWRDREENAEISVDDFVDADLRKIKWSGDLKTALKKGVFAAFSDKKLRTSLYRPFTRSFLFFDRLMNNGTYLQPYLFPTPETEQENRVIQLKTGQEWPMFALMVNKIADQLPQSGSQCFPFYIYDEDGTNRRENITDWALQNFRKHYGDNTITKWDIFHYTYGILHHAEYRERYAADLKRDLPHIPYARDFWAFANAGAQLAELHVNYEAQPEYPLTFVEDAARQLDFRVEKMRLSKDKTSLIYNEFLTLSGIPAEVFSYRLGQYSALEWVVKQYRVKTDARSGIVNDPNDAANPRYIVGLIGSVITVSLETCRIVAVLPELS